jgi:hypothetical protein
MGCKIKVSLSDEARDYIRGRSGALTIDVIEFFGCCGIFYAPNAASVRPIDPEDYDSLSVDGIEVFVNKEVVAEPEGIRISIPGFWMTRGQVDNFRVDGVIYEQPYNLNGRITMD